jgi:hypothetical protein
VMAVLASRRLSAPAAGESASGGDRGADLSFSVAPGEAVTIVTTMLTSVTTGALNDTLALALEANTHTDATTTVAQAVAFWRTFWGHSAITLPEQWAAAER